MGLFNLALANPYFIGAAVVLGGIAAGMVAVYNATKDATNAQAELNRQRELFNTIKSPTVTPEQINADLYEGIIPGLTPLPSTGGGLAGQFPTAPSTPAPKPTTPTVPTTPTKPPVSSGGGGGGIAFRPTSITNNIIVEKPAATAGDIVKALDKYNKQTGGGAGRFLAV